MKTKRCWVRPPAWVNFKKSHKNYSGLRVECWSKLDPRWNGPGRKRRRNLIDGHFFRRSVVGSRVDVDVGLHVAHLRPDLGVVVAGRRSWSFLRYRGRRIRNRKWFGDADADDALGSALQSLDGRGVFLGKKFKPKGNIFLLAPNIALIYVFLPHRWCCYVFHPWSEKLISIASFRGWEFIT